MEDNKVVIRGLIAQVYNEGNLDVVDEFMAQTFTITQPPPNTGTSSMDASTSWGSTQVLTLILEARPAEVPATHSDSHCS